MSDGVPTLTSGARRRHCIMYACLRHASRPEVARAKFARPEVEHQQGSRRPRRVRECAIASRTRACGTTRDRRWREPNSLDQRSSTNRGPDAHVGCANAQLRPVCVPAARPATGGSASQTRSTGGQTPTGVPTPTSGARMRNCIPPACLRHAPRPEVARAKTA